VASGLSTLRFPPWGRIDIRLNPSSAIYSLNSFAAAMLALFIGFAADLERPYWAVLTVYITVQPLTGALRSKAVYRVLGTILGGVAAVVLVPNFVNSPATLSFVMATWIGLCLYLSVLDRTPRSYVFLLGGYTTAIIGFPVVDTPLDVFDTAVARVEEITVGIFCAAITHSIVFPREVTVAVNNRVQEFLSDARKWIADALKGLHGAHETEERRRLASDVTELELLATHLPFDTSNLTPTTRGVRALQDSLARLLPLTAAVEDRIGALLAIDALPQNIDALTREVDEFVGREATTGEEAQALRARCMAAEPRIDFSEPRATWRSLLVIGAAVRMSDLVEAWRDALLLAAYVRNPLMPTPEINTLVRARARRPLHSDSGLALLSAFALMVAVLGVCAFWIVTAWPSGAFAVLFASVFSSFFASLDDPAPAIQNFLRWTFISLPIAAFYQFAVLPAIDGFAMLVLAFAPLYLVLGYMQADPNQFTRAMPLLIGVSGSLALQETYSEDFTSFINTYVAQIIGIAASLWSTRIFRSVGAAWSARRILKRGWRDLADLAAGRRRDDYLDWTSLMLDRMGLISARLALAQHPEEFFATDALADMRTGLNIITLRDAAATRNLPQVARVLDLIAEAYERLIAGERDVFGPQLLHALDETIRALADVPIAAHDIRVPASLIGLRRALYPNVHEFPA
jgi:uncharacterized membrane protein YccC